jgi:hypothetical protein
VSQTVKLAKQHNWDCVLQAMPIRTRLALIGEEGGSEKETLISFILQRQLASN